MKFVCILFAVIVLWLIIGIVCYRKLQVTAYTVPLEGIEKDVRIILLSDLHERQFGNGNTELIGLIKAQEPDLIVLAGDLFSRNAKDKEVDAACDFAAALHCIAPTYYSLGNHESEYADLRGYSVFERFTEAGITVLNDGYRDLTVNGSTFRLGGTCRLGYRDGAGLFDPEAEEFLLDYCDTQLPTVLLSHRPEAFSFKYACQEWDIDLILSGHTHGGMMRLPGNRRLFAPIQGFFPKTVYGEYVFFDTKMIVTSGLAGYGNLPRLYNPPEICVITLTNHN